MWPDEEAGKKRSLEEHQSVWGTVQWERLCRRRLTQANKEVENGISLCGVPSSGRDYVAGGRGRQIKKLRTTSVCVGYRPVGEIMSPGEGAGK